MQSQRAKRGDGRGVCAHQHRAQGQPTQPALHGTTTEWQSQRDIQWAGVKVQHAQQEGKATQRQQAPHQAIEQRWQKVVPMQQTEDHSAAIEDRNHPHGGDEEAHKGRQP